jgi:hypothetical protein
VAGGGGPEVAIGQDGELYDRANLRVFLKVLHKAPHNLKTVAMSRVLGGKIDSRSIAVLRLSELPAWVLDVAEKHSREHSARSSSPQVNIG